MPKLDVPSTSRKVRAFVRAIIERNRARLSVSAADALVKVLHAALTGSQLGEAAKILRAMREELNGKEALAKEAVP